MLTIIAICLGVLTCTFLVICGYFVFVFSSLKKTINEIEELVVYIKGEIFRVKEPISKGLNEMGKIAGLMKDISSQAKSVKNKIVLPCALILGIYAGIKAGLNIFLKGGDKDGK